MRGNAIKLFVVMASGLLAVSAWAAPVTVDSTSFQLTLRGPDFADPSNLQTAFGPGLAGLGTVGPLSNSGGSASADFSFTGSALSFSNLNFAIHGLSSANNTLAELSANGIRFTPDVDVNWTLSGSLTWSPGASQSTVAIYNKLIDITDIASPVTITLDSHKKNGTSSALTATVGTNISGGINTLGVTSGTLLAGHQYEWDVDYAVYTGGAGGGPGSGSFVLGFKPVPEPGTLSLGMLVAALTTLRRSRRPS